MPGSRAIELSFTPAVAGTLKVKVRATMYWNGGSGSNGYMRTFREQSGTTNYGKDATTPKRTEQPVASEDTFTVTAGSLVKMGLYGGVTGAAAVELRGLYAEAEFTPS